MQGYRILIAINVVVLLILSLFIVRFRGNFSGATWPSSIANVATGQKVVGEDSTAVAKTDSAIPSAAGDGVVGGPASPGSENVILRFAGETVIATPFLRDFRPQDNIPTFVEKHRDVCLDAGELYDQRTGKLWAVSISTRAVYEVEELYLDTQDGRLFMKEIDKSGDAASWGHLSLSDQVTLNMERTRRLRFIAADGVRRFYVLAGSSESSRQ